MEKYVGSVRYAKLPTETEKMAVEKEFKEAKEAEPGIKAPADDVKVE